MAICDVNVAVKNSKKRLGASGPTSAPQLLEVSTRAGITKTNFPSRIAGIWREHLASTTLCTKKGRLPTRRHQVPRKDSELRNREGLCGRRRPA